MLNHRKGINRHLAFAAAGFLKSVTSRFLDHRSSFGKPTIANHRNITRKEDPLAAFLTEGGLARWRPLAYVSAHE